MDARIRTIRNSEIPLLDDFLYEAVWQPDPRNPLPREVIRMPALRAYVEAFGARPTDCCLVAEVGGRVVGAAWSRCLHGFGWVGEGIPELAVALLPPYRGRGIGTQLLRAMLDELRGRGFDGVSLSVQQANPAVGLYRRLGFRVVEAAAGEYVMRCDWR